MNLVWKFPLKYMEICTGKQTTFSLTILCIYGEVISREFFKWGLVRERYSPFWCIRETIDEDENEASKYVITNDDLQ